jgi:metallo-beta-lactamase family protein
MPIFIWHARETRLAGWPDETIHGIIETGARKGVRQALAPRLLRDNRHKAAPRQLVLEEGTMQITFCGGAQTVTGSQFLFQVNGSKVLLECGLFQGRREETYRINHSFQFDPSDIDAVVLTHAHMDHSGNIPNLTRHGFTKSIYAAAPTVDLCKIMLRDSAYLQEKDIEWVNKIRAKHHQPPMPPLYSIEDAENAMDQFVGVDYDKTFTVAPGVTVTFRDAGHILGSASVLLELEENGRTMRVGITGDIGRPHIPIMNDPNELRDLDALIMESTYGNRLHGSFDEVEEEIAEAIREIAQNGGKMIIPSFAVGRTQLIVYLLHKLFNQDRIPEIPIYVDSPMACHATEVFRRYPDYFDRETNRIFLDDHEDPFGFGRLKYVREAAESKALNGLAYPHVIISASGMAEGGRILHHLRNNIHNWKTLLLFVGYAARNTLARKIMDGEKRVKIFGEEHKVNCKIKIMDSFSAHADRRDLLNYARMTPPEKLKHIFLVHGEPDQSIPFRDALRSSGYQQVFYPAPGETREL